MKAEQVPKELGNKHLETLRHHTGLADIFFTISTDHSQISIQYAITILKELAKECTSDFGLVVLKIDELKKLIA